MQLNLSELLRAMVRAESAHSLADAVTRGFAASASVVLVRVWLFEGGFARVTSSAGTPSGGGSYSRLDGEFREMAIAEGKILEIAAARNAFVVRGIRGDEDWLINSAWAARQGVRAFLAFPWIARDEVVGLVALFDRELPDPTLIADLALVADIAAYRVGDSRSTSVPASDLRPHEEGRRSTEVLTRADLRQIEKANIEAALARTNGKIFGAGGAAALLGMRPTTLASRIKVLRIR